MKKALVLGVTGQDGSYLADILLSHGYEVHGTVRRSSVDNLQRLRHIPIEKLKLHHADLTDPLSVNRVIESVRPNEIYNEADQDHVDISFATPGYSADVTYAAVVRLLESVKAIDRDIRIFQPVTALMFGTSPPPQNESSPLQPQSPYACAKTAAYFACQHYRREYGMFVSMGILYNHDSPRRNGSYLLHHISKAIVRIEREKQEYLALPCLDMQVDIGYAREYMQVAYLMLQQQTPTDYVIATGQPYSIRDLAEAAMFKCELPLYQFDQYVRVDPSLLRPGKQPTLIGNSAKAKGAFGLNFVHNAKSVIEMLVEHTMDQAVI